MSKNKQEYDEDRRMVIVYRDFKKAQTLVPPDEVQGAIAMLRDGKNAKGQEVLKVRYVFENRATADYNHQALAFAGVETFVGDEKRNKPFDPEDGGPEFSVREDFGID